MEGVISHTSEQDELTADEGKVTPWAV
jgi:hypothetical protein